MDPHIDTPRTPTPSTTGHLVVGEVLVDVVHRPVGPPVAHPGGSPGNVALGLARLGREVTLVTELADDAHGALVDHHLRSAGVRLDAVRPASGRTATATAVLDHAGSATYTFDLGWTLPGTRTTPPVRHVHAGSIGAFLAPGSDVVEQLLASSRAHATTSLDPNIRPDLVGDPVTVRGRLCRLLPLTDVLKASDEDVAWLHPGADPLEIALSWAATGPALVVLTLGAAGSVVVAPSGTVHVAPVPVEVVDTVGAGDAYMAALLDGLDALGLLGAAHRAALRTVDVGRLQQVADRAALAAALTVARAGAQPPSRSELDGVRRRRGA